MKILAIFCLLSVCSIAAGVFAPVMLIPAGFFAFGALGAAFNLGKQRGFVVDEDNLPIEIYQVIAITMAGSFPVAILRNSKKKSIACRSCSSSGGFDYFSVVGERNEKFFVPKSIKQSTTANYPVVGDELVNSHGG